MEKHQLTRLAKASALTIGCTAVASGALTTLSGSWTAAAAGLTTLIVKMSMLQAHEYFTQDRPAIINAPLSDMWGGKAAARQFGAKRAKEVAFAATLLTIGTGLGAYLALTIDIPSNPGILNAITPVFHSVPK